MKKMGIVLTMALSGCTTMKYGHSTGFKELAPHSYLETFSQTLEDGSRIETELRETLHGDCTFVVEKQKHYQHDNSTHNLETVTVSKCQEVAVYSEKQWQQFDTTQCQVRNQYVDTNLDSAFDRHIKSLECFDQWGHKSDNWFFKDSNFDGSYDTCRKNGEEIPCK